MKYPNGWFRKKPCRRCKAEFQPLAPSHLYCSEKCKQGASYYPRIYGITADRVIKMAKEQKHRCHLCRGEGFLMDPRSHKTKLVVDHCHASGTVRRLLCHNCNRGLGLFKDKPGLLRRAADYIETYREGATTIRKE